VIFARPEPVMLGSRDRATPVADAVNGLAALAGVSSFSDVWIEYPDTNEGKTLSSLSKGLQPYLQSALKERNLLGAPAQAPRLHVFLTSKESAYIGWTMPGKSSAWPLGIPRLRMPSSAPSRSTLKLAEAFMAFLEGKEESLMQPDMRAVDLGAAPGGWTWQLIHRGLHVTAVDNGPLSGDLVGNALVKHLREDGFRFRPKRPVEWLVCDMVEQPSRIAALVAEWIAEGWAQHAIFNLKLPMKKRLAEIDRCRRIVDERLGEAGVRYHLKMKQLYHDREEVTAFLTRQPKRFGQ
jgi:23S rRNA (cytidine2498-2'-O)-methyltransferase